jgi:hypothetical protein
MMSWRKMLGNASEHTRQGGGDLRRIGSGRQPVAPVKKKQECQKGSTGHQDFQQEIRAQLPPSSMQDLQTHQDYLHLRLPTRLIDLATVQVFIT